MFQQISQSRKKKTLILILNHSHFRIVLLIFQTLDFCFQIKKRYLNLFNKVKNLIFINENIYSRFEIYLTFFM